MANKEDLKGYGTVPYEEGPHGKVGLKSAEVERPRQRRVQPVVYLCGKVGVADGKLAARLACACWQRARDEGVPVASSQGDKH